MPAPARLILLLVTLAVAALATPVAAVAAITPDPNDYPPALHLGTFPHRMTADTFEHLEIPATCSRPAQAQLTFFDNQQHKWIRSAAADADGVTIPVAPPPEVLRGLIGHPLLVAVYAVCLDEAGQPGPVKDEIQLTVAKRKPHALARCTPRWQASYRLSELLNRGLPVPIQCDHATKVSFWLDPQHEERLGIPRSLWSRPAVAKVERFTAAGTKTVRLRPQAWIRPYLRRARSPFSLTIQVGVQTDATDLFEVAIARTLRVRP